MLLAGALGAGRSPRSLQSLETHQRAPARRLGPFARDRVPRIDVASPHPASPRRREAEGGPTACHCGQGPMDQRIESFLADALALAAEHPDATREGVRVALADREAILRAQETHKRMKEKAAHACHALCRARVVEEMQSAREADLRAFEAGAERFRVSLEAIDARSTLDCWTGRQGCRGGCHPAKPRRTNSTAIVPRTPIKNPVNAAI